MEKETKKTSWRARYDSDFYDGGVFGELFCGSRKEALDYFCDLLVATAEGIASDTGEDWEVEWQVIICPVNSDGDYDFSEYEDRDEYTCYYHHLPAADVELTDGRCEDPMFQRNTKPILRIEKKDGRIKSLKMGFVDNPEDVEKHEWIERDEGEYVCRWCGMVVKKDKYDNYNGDPTLYGRKCSSYGDEYDDEDELFALLLDEGILFEGGVDNEDHCWELVIGAPLEGGGNYVVDYFYKCRKCGLKALKINYVPMSCKCVEIDEVEYKKTYLEKIERAEKNRDPAALPESVVKILETGKTVYLDDIAPATAEKLEKIITARLGGRVAAG